MAELSHKVAGRGPDEAKDIFAIEEKESTVHRFAIVNVFFAEKQTSLQASKLR